MEAQDFFNLHRTLRSRNPRRLRNAFPEGLLWIPGFLWIPAYHVSVDKTRLWTCVVSLTCSTIWLHVKWQNLRKILEMASTRSDPPPFQKHVSFCVAELAVNADENTMQNVRWAPMTCLTSTTCHREVERGQRDATIFLILTCLGIEVLNNPILTSSAPHSPAPELPPSFPPAATLHPSCALRGSGCQTIPLRK